ncbi:UNVERIFIED_CONTAM: Retrovirus-related Pol polyprotein from transposon TNT 1-94 [Sesamum latifolium]|uniref:Retrovirus-related Pol polyprotein from transposon TNT 1-94 n=1 Tax=Sesamum latifolium TaxID=2727402 RepID=A0AAW2UIT1_9LAMI
MVEDRSVAEQTHEIINLEHALVDAEMKLPEKFLVMSIMDKFFKSWKNFGMTLKHQKGRLSLDDLMIAISIEEEHRNQTHKMTVEHQLRTNLIVGKQKVGHWASFCPDKKVKTGQAAVNMVVGGSSGASTSGATEGPSLEAHYSRHCLAHIREHVRFSWPHIAWEHGIEWASERNRRRFQSTSRPPVIVGSLIVDEIKQRILSASLRYSVSTCGLYHLWRIPWLVDKTQTGKKLKRLRSDRGGEYESSKFNEYCQTFGIIHEETPPYSPSSNGVTDRKDRIFKDMINSLILTSGLSKYLWEEALNTACHILNRVPLKHNTKIPGIEVNTIVEFRDDVFIEDVFPMKTGIPSSVSLDDSLASTSIPKHMEKMTNVEVNPKAKQWKEVVKSEMDSIVSNEIWELVDLPPGCTTIGSRLTTIGVLIALDSVYNLPIHQMDVKTVFLYGELEEKIYMDQPEGFVAHGNERKV